MRKMTLAFNMDNDAFNDTREEVARILLDVHNRVLHDHRVDGVIHDVNGNKIGTWSITSEED